MRTLLVTAMCAALAGCATVPATENPWLSWLEPSNPARYGYTDYDPCIRCGEGWIFLNIDETQSLKEQTHAGQN